MLFSPPHDSLFLNANATYTRINNTGTSIKGPIVAARASSDFTPKTATATAMASSKLLLPAVNDCVTTYSYEKPPAHLVKKKVAKNIIPKYRSIGTATRQTDPI